MKKEIADKWVKALNSDQYQQTQGRLCRNGYKYDSFCCLGVLTDLFIQDKHKTLARGKEIYGWDTITEFGKRILAFEEETDNLPDKVKKWAGMKSREGELLHGEQQKDIKIGDQTYDSLIDMNDSGKDFKTIAKVIEQNWRYL